MQAPSEEHLVALLDQWSPQWKWRGRQRAIGAGAYEWYCTLGLYAFGGNAPNVSKALSMKEACTAINRFMRHRFPNGTWTSIAVLLKPTNRTASRHAKHGWGIQISLETECGLKTMKGWGCEWGWGLVSSGLGRVAACVTPLLGRGLTGFRVDGASRGHGV